MPETQSGTSHERLPDPYPSDFAMLALQVEDFVQRNYPDEIQWVENRPDLMYITNNEVFEEYTHVIYVSGFRADTVHSKWSSLKEAYRYWDTEKVREDQQRVTQEALGIINNPRKVKNIVNFCNLVYAIGWPEVRSRYLETVEDMQSLPGVGPVLSYHLARNLGHNTVKPDVHLTRLAKYYQFESPMQLCQEMGHYMSRPWRLATVDLMAWRYCATHLTSSLR